MLQSLMSFWKEILALSSSTLLSRDWTLASNILRSSGWCACLLSGTRRPLRVPLLCRRVGLQNLFNCPAGREQRIRFGKVIFLVIMLVELVSYRRSEF
jgi:hypothetical protein